MARNERNQGEISGDTCVAVLLFSKLNKMFLGYFDPEKIFLDNEIK